MAGLIDGLPDALALQCLALVPLRYHPLLRLVCRSWKAAICSSELFMLRHEVGASEKLLCVCAYEPENTWQLYDPASNLWMTLPVLPSSIRRLSRFGVASAAGKLFVLGGESDAVHPLTGEGDGFLGATDIVWSFDPVLHVWSRCASMLVRRALFACCVLDGKIVVAGGLTSGRKMTSNAEIYDPEKDTWKRISDLHYTCHTACSGIVICGKLHVFYKALSTVQVLESNKHDWVVENCGYPQGQMAVVRGEIFVSDDGFVIKKLKEKVIEKALLSAAGFRRMGFGMIGLRDELYVIGGVHCPEPVIKPLSDAHALTFCSEKASWRELAPMTKCCGSILGCAILKI